MKIRQKLVPLRQCFFCLSFTATFCSCDSSLVKLSRHEIQLHMDYTFFVRILSYLDSRIQTRIYTDCIQSVYVQRCSQDMFVFGLEVQVQPYIRKKYSSYPVAFCALVFISSLCSYNLANLIRRTLTLVI